MHAHDRTLLANLGFADKDKLNPKHDLACRYLAAPEQRERLSAKYGLLDLKESVTINDRVTQRVVRSYREIDQRFVETEAYLERPISKGAGQYQTTIGFIDVLVVGRQEVLCQGATIKWRRGRGGKEIPKETPYEGWESSRNTYSTIAVEVKIDRLPVTDIIRQINLYREYHHTAERWLVATLFALSDSEIDALQSQDITPIRLGPGFASFVEEQRNRPPALERPEEF